MSRGGSSILTPQGATKVCVKGILAVQLHHRNPASANAGQFAFNMDPGETTGIAITRESPDGQHRTIAGAYEHQHRNKDIHRNLNDRRDCRRNRRCRLRRRPARFDNRANNSAEGWLPPSTASLVNDADTIVRTMLQPYPVTKTRIEHLRFDNQLMQNPNIRGVEHQHGTLQGWQLRHYILHRDRWQCQYRHQPNTKNNPINLDSVIPESKSSPTVVGNLITACKRCNTKKTNRSLADFLTQDPERLAKIQKRADQLAPLTSTGHLNSVMPAMLRIPENTGTPVTVSEGASTAYTRHQLGMPESHVNDAACLDLTTEVNNHSSPATVLKRQRRHTRQSIPAEWSKRPPCPHQLDQPAQPSPHPRYPQLNSETSHHPEQHS